MRLIKEFSYEGLDDCDFLKARAVESEDKSVLIQILDKNQATRTICKSASLIMAWATVADHADAHGCSWKHIAKDLEGVISSSSRGEAA